MGARFSAPVQTGPGAQLASCTMGTGSFPGVKSGWGVPLTPHPLPVPWSKKSRAIPILPLWAVRPVQSLSACTKVHFTFTLRFRIRQAQSPLPHTPSLCVQGQLAFLLNPLARGGIQPPVFNPNTTVFYQHVAFTCFGSTFPEHQRLFPLTGLTQP